MPDGDLRKLFQQHLPNFHWQSIETWSTGQGVPDTNYCSKGIEGWIEFKFTEGWKFNMRPEQIGWIERRLRNGGRVFIAIRRKKERTAMKERVDQLILLPGSMARSGSLTKVPLSLFLGTWNDGPAHWDWPKIAAILLKH